MAIPYLPAPLRQATRTAAAKQSKSLKKKFKTQSLKDKVAQQQEAVDRELEDLNTQNINKRGHQNFRDKNRYRAVNNQVNRGKQETQRAQAGLKTRASWDAFFSPERRKLRNMQAREEYDARNRNFQRNVKANMDAVRERQADPDYAKNKANQDALRAQMAPRDVNKEASMEAARIKHESGIFNAGEAAKEKAASQGAGVGGQMQAAAHARKQFAFPAAKDVVRGKVQPKSKAPAPVSKPIEPQPKIAETVKKPTPAPTKPIMEAAKPKPAAPLKPKPQVAETAPKASAIQFPKIDFKARQAQLDKQNARHDFRKSLEAPKPEQNDLSRISGPGKKPLKAVADYFTASQRGVAGNKGRQSVKPAPKKKKKSNLALASTL